MLDVSSVISSLSGNSKANKSASNGLTSNYNTFLTLLTTQLKNQDPMSPMDSSKFTNQLVQFSQVEQQIQTNATLSNMLKMSVANSTSIGLGMMGKNVSMKGQNVSFDGSKPIKFSYNLPSAAASASVSVLDAHGNVIKQFTPELTAGDHTVTWDGTDNNGQPVTPGNYTVSVGATASDGSAINATTTVPGVVTGFENGSDGSIKLDVNGQQVPLSNIKSVST